MRNPRFVCLFEGEKIKNYIGADVYEPSLRKAKENLLEEFHLTDFFGAMASKMQSISSRGVAFNVLADENNGKDSGLFYYSVEKIGNVCRKIMDGSGNMCFINDFVRNEAHFYLWKF